MGTKKALAMELADEAAGVIESCGLTPKELRSFLASWICDCADRDLEKLRGEGPAMRRRHERVMKAATVALIRGGR